MIPIVNPTLCEWEAVIADFRQAWDSGQVTTGKFTRRFEAEVEQRLDVPHAVMVQSCTAGLMLVLRALELQGEVIMPAFTWTATAHAAVWNGLTPVFADISPDTYTLDPEKAVAAITSQTAAIMPVNVFGCPPDYEAFKKLGERYSLPLVYDSAQGLGSQYLDASKKWRFSGNFGTAEIFSMSPTKVISAMEGGLITTHNTELAQKLCQMRDYGKTPDGEDIAWLGLSARVPEINAIVAYHNFAHMKELVRRRQELSTMYRNRLAGLKGVTFQEITNDRQTSGNYFTIFIDAGQARHSRDEVYRGLKEKQIQAKKYFYPAIHQQKVYEQLGAAFRGKLPVTEEAAVSGLALPMYSHMKDEVVVQVSEAVWEILGVSLTGFKSQA
jgi:dTDP-4-amino-4,6-dideoxygalactose transaminase